MRAVWLAGLHNAASSNVERKGFDVIKVLTCRSTKDVSINIDDFGRGS